MGYSLNAAIEEFSWMYQDDSDPWGSAMAAIFDICNTLTRRGDDVPHEWGYQCGAIGPYPVEEQAFDWMGFDSPQLIELVNTVLMPQRDKAIADGLDY